MILILLLILSFLFLNTVYLIYQVFFCFHSIIIAYVDIDLPSASTEYGNLGGSFGTDEKQSYRLVHVDPNRVECKCTALDTYMIICKYRLESTKQCLSSEMIDSVMSFIIKTCQEENDSLRIHGV